MNEELKAMLTLAAKAAGHTVVRVSDDGLALLLEGVQEPWNPRNSSADAFDLAAKLRINIEHMAAMHGRDYGINAWPRGMGDCGVEVNDIENYAAAMRLAVTQAAAAIGERQP
jgi:hypothetical protein